MKLTVIGGGGVRAPFLAKSLAKSANNIGITELVFMDNNVEKLNIFGKLSKYVSEEVNKGLKFTITTDDIEAVKDADFVITTIRSGGDESRVFDERTALDLGVLGQETTGAGGFAMALRSVPVLIDLCDKVKKHSKKDVLLFNFTNPSGIVTQALRDEGFDFVYGICDAPSGFQSQLAKILGADEKDFNLTCFGLNHLSWFRDFKYKGEDVYDELISKENIFNNSELRYFDKKMVQMIGNKDLPNEYLYFYYYRNKSVDAIINSKETRGETILEINKRMISLLKDINISEEPEKAFDIFIKHYFEREDKYFSIESDVTRKKTTHTPTLQEFASADDAGGYAGVALNFINGFIKGENIRMTVLVPNNGSLEFLDDSDVIEISCEIEKGKVTPTKVDKADIDEFQINLISTVKYFEHMAVRAIKYKDKNIAIKALMAHPQINSYPIACELLDKYLKEYEEYVGEWK